MKTIALATTLLCALISPAAAESRYELERLQPPTSLTHNYLGQSSARLIEPGDLSFGFASSYAASPLVVESQGERVGQIVDQALTSHVLIGAGILSFLEAGVDIPFSLNHGGKMAREPTLAMPGTHASLGDLRLIPKARLFEQSGIALAAIVDVRLPTGRDETYQGEGLRAEARVAADYALHRLVRVGANIGYLLRGEANVADLPVTDALVWSVASSVSVPGTPAQVVAELFGGAQQAGREQNLVVTQSPLEALIGGKYALNDSLTIAAAAGMGILPGYGVPDWRALVSVGHRMPMPRLDAGESAEPTSVLVATAEAAPPVAAPQESQPPEPMPAPEVDTDADGLLDSQDRCPTAAEDRDAFDDADGCPDTDDDQDGVADTIDRCPREPGRAEIKGCPSRDRDGDTVADHLDNCPEEAGSAANQGCRELQLVALTAERIEIKGTVYFETHKDGVQRKSLALLDGIASVMTAHPEIKLLRIEGHTDDKGDEAANQELSQRRADAVMRYLIAKGVAAERLQARGYGKTRPVKAGTSAAARAANRRVEFVLPDH